MKIPTDRKLTFVEYLALSESDSETDIRQSDLDHWTKNLPNMLNSDYTKEHSGDCTNICCTCVLCWLESELKDYREYFFDKVDLQGNEIKEAQEITTPDVLQG